jgi:hypothetical protein
MLDSELSAPTDDAPDLRRIATHWLACTSSTGFTGVRRPDLVGSRPRRHVQLASTI